MYKSGTQGVTFLRVRFAKVRPHSEKWFIVIFAPAHTSIPSTFPGKKRRQLKIQLLHRFIFGMFKSLIHTSYTGVIENGTTLFPCLAMIIAEQPE